MNSLSDYKTFDRPSILALHGLCRHRQQISVTGLSGTGKSTIAKLLAAYLQGLDDSAVPVPIISGGTFMRQRAQELGYGEGNEAIGEFAAHMKAHPEEGHDKACDEFLIAQANEKPRAVFEGRLVRCWTPGAFAVCITCDINEAAKRRTPQGGNALVTLSELKERDKADGRYADLYPGCIWIPGDYDYVCHNQGKSVEASVDEIIRAHQVWLATNAVNLVC